MSIALQPAAIETHRQKRTAAITSLLAALGMVALKLAAGLLTGSLALLSEAAHSGLDLIASSITLFSVQVSDRPADEDHNYGHGKVESLSAFVEVFLMIASCVWIVTEAVQRIFLHRVALTLPIWAFAVPLVAITVDSLRSRSLLRVARRYGSPALEADAVHFRTDIWSSAAVLIGLVTAWPADASPLRGLSLPIPSPRSSSPPSSCTPAGSSLARPSTPCSIRRRRRRTAT